MFLEINNPIILSHFESNYQEINMQEIILNKKAVLKRGRPP